MRSPITLTAAALLIGAGLTAPMALAADDTAMNADVAHLEHEWSRITYQVKDHDAQLAQIDSLGKEAATIVQRYPGRAEPLIWNGIIISEEAGMASVFTALGYAKDARAMFEQAEKIDPKAIHGSVPMSLGTLYYRVPGFPVGFGDNDKARKYLELAMTMDPNGLDANYFYGDFLIERGEYAKAKQVLTHALEAPVDPNRPVWEAGRRAEVRALIEKANAKVASR